MTDFLWNVFKSPDLEGGKFMSESWKEVKRRLQELQRQVPEPLLIELTYKDGSMEQLSVEELQDKDSCSWKQFRIITGNKRTELAEFLSWLVPECVID